MAWARVTSCDQICGALPLSQSLPLSLSQHLPIWGHSLEHFQHRQENERGEAGLDAQDAAL